MYSAFQKFKDTLKSITAHCVLILSSSSSTCSGPKGICPLHQRFLVLPILRCSTGLYCQPAVWDTIQMSSPSLFCVQLFTNVSVVESFHFVCSLLQIARISSPMPISWSDIFSPDWFYFSSSRWVGYPLFELSTQQVSPLQGPGSTRANSILGKWHYRHSEKIDCCILLRVLATSPLPSPLPSLLQKS